MTNPPREPAALDGETEGPSLLRLTPSGALALSDAALTTLSLASPARRFAVAFVRDARGALLSLAGESYGGEGSLPAPLPWLRALATRFVTAVCATPELESVRARARPALDPSVRQALRAEAPPFDGAEYLTESVVDALWSDFGDALSDALSSHRGDVGSWLRALDPRFHPVGRVCFHLAERRGDERAPFAFLATFTTGVGASGRAQHAPLGRAVAEAASARDGARLDALLEPVQRAAEKSAVVRELLESRELFQPIAWTAAEAHAFLRDAALCEEAGVSVRVPDWWQPARPTRPTVRVSVGDSGPARLGLDAMLSWSVDLCIDGEPLTEREIAELMAGGAGLVRLRGRWVEADPARVEALLSRWREALSSARSGLSLHRALRMIAGAPLGDAVGPSALDEDSAGWVRIEAGPWLAERLKGLREPTSLGETTDDPSLRATLRPYQREGVAWLEFLTELGLGGVLADDMGLGKTLQVIAWITREKRRMAARRGQKRGASAPHLLVVPASLLANWRDELARFAPELSVKTAHPSQTRDPVPSNAAELDRWRKGADVVLTSYGAIARSDALRALDWSLVALDEAQAIKNPSTRQAQSVKSLRSTARLALNRTPLENLLKEISSL
jgi:non-specific serine/threonine protein kinase